jgi:inner membrane protease subunit 2
MHEDVVLVNRWVRSTQKYRIGDIVTFWYAHSSRRMPVQGIIQLTRHNRAPGVNKSVLVTKRIVALQGDVVRTLPPWKDRMVRVPPGHAWVEGDEPNRSRDSNTFGPVGALSIIP